MPSNKKLLQAAAGNAGESLYVEDVFSTYLYEGNFGNPNTITNGIDLAGEGGLVWIKSRSGAYNHGLIDTERGRASELHSNTNGAEDVVTSASNGITSFNSDGFTLGTDQFTIMNSGGSTFTYASWSFRKAEKFFDVVTWTGNSTAGRTIAHNLGSAPAFVMVKRTNTTNNWICWHSALTNTQYIQINATTQALSDGGIFWNSTTPDASNLTLGSDSGVNGSGSTYVAYLFASDAGGFGDDGSESIIKCGSYTGNGGTFDLNLGFEPQWFLAKCTSTTGNWNITDNMRGFASPSSTSVANTILQANTSSAEQADGLINPTATGMATTYGNLFNENGKTYIYIAIRRPMKTPESGTEVFGIDTSNSTGNAPPQFSSSFPVDMAIRVDFSESATYRYRETRSRLVPSRLKLNTTDAEVGSNPSFFAYMDGCYDNNTVNTSHYAWMFKRATGFMDVVAYDGTGVSPMNVPHNLGVTPELIITKARTSGDTYGWWTYPLFVPDAYGNTGKVKLNDDTAYGSTGWTGPMATSTAITVPSSLFSNKSGESYVAYLFASLDGISKLGMYTGTGSDLNVDCGFSAGARFILIKRTDSTGDWYVWDSERGITVGNDPYFLINSTAAEVTGTDYIDPLNAGFTVTSSAPAALNASGGSYIFLAIS